MPRLRRADIMERLTKMVHDRQPILGGGAGTGLSAKCEEAGGVDLIVIYNSGRYRMAGRGSLAGMLAYGNANEIVVEMAREVLPVVRRTPVLAGVNGTDPFCHFDHFLNHLGSIGFSGVQNFPTVGLIDGTFRASLEETGMGYGLEVDLIRMARAKDFLTTPYVFNPEDAVAMVQAGADILVAHMGLTTGGAIGATTSGTLEDCVGRINAIADAALRERPGIILLCHGGPIAQPEDAQYILSRCPDCHGFYGASSMERLPSETALIEQTKRFKQIIR
ncbi:phosphoenolpyruvate hydrolase family protein [Lichenicoccus roseus]|uniref:Phosphoenolpyruvate hydrolase family protein n=1 Tax=Lichenicoccus roseus TaxID=2683649 RepID=A0A5R9J112_9PROT|nr:phosphoenolpyruvate hydrolase family protein [Lichenicoccus roseus]TLU71360.1 phosphoenolpyruvate hydrolase family protein [Lichenicoccus roseus]